MTSNLRVVSQRFLFLKITDFPVMILKPYHYGSFSLQEGKVILERALVTESDGIEEIID